MFPGEHSHPWLRPIQIIHCKMNLLLSEDKNIPKQCFELEFAAMRTSFCVYTVQYGSH